MKKVLLALAAVAVMAMATPIQEAKAEPASALAALAIDAPMFVVYDVLPVVGLTYLIATGYDPWTPNFETVEYDYPEQHHNF